MNRHRCHPASPIVAIVLMVAVLGIDAAVSVQSALMKAASASEPLQPVGRVVNTQQSLHLKTDCEIDTPLIRLRDVAVPVGPAGSHWQRLGSTVIAMLPVDQSEVTIDRDRLIECLRLESQIPLFQWEGANRVRVRLQAVTTADTSNAPNTVQHAGQPLVQQVSLVQSGDRQSPTADLPLLPPPLPNVSQPRTAISNDPQPPTAIPDAASIERISRLIQFAIDRYDLSLRDAYEITIAPQQVGWQSLGDLRRVDRVDFQTPPQAGAMSAMVSGMSSRQEIQAQLEIQFTPRPMVVVAQTSLRRGHVITTQDLTLIPAPRNLDLQNVLTNLDDAVDMQTTGVLQRHQPITMQAIARPTLIQRGDLVEVQVLAGGVTVATNGKALAAGAAGDMIAVETLEPRKRVMARVARPGIVEIITRPTRVRP